MPRARVRARAGRSRLTLARKLRKRIPNYHNYARLLVCNSTRANRAIIIQPFAVRSFPRRKLSSVSAESTSRKSRLLTSFGECQEAPFELTLWLNARKSGIRARAQARVCVCDACANIIPSKMHIRIRAVRARGFSRARRAKCAHANIT